ncbi:MAG: hypothetical protein PHO13_09705 [Fermentimonas sp.]|mgnify:FL=1|jgi:DNA-directed RNA polymerase subunit H (RpoH/RPB5)|nr:hypothetical protein [Fermentimonas sp.]MDD2930844.1 hypothetical protein [Fermentimonas sp.]MDD3189758.1 hypothetical protein [Fermentimonas sp.]MDD3511730.1 hypothetical protein [Fermentimonas sp.]MDD4284140.1 hypothetical protein [Fermentimonas sp.]
MRQKNALSHYLAPDIEVIDIKIEQNILQDGSTGPMELPSRDW